MTAHSLPHYLEELDRLGRLARITASVDPGGETAWIARRMAAQRGVAALFTSIEGAEFPLLAGPLAPAGSLAQVLGAKTEDELAAVLQSKAEADDPAAGLLRRIAGAVKGDAARPTLLNTVRAADSQQVVRMGDDFDLTQLPALTLFADQTHPLLSAAVTLWADRDNGPGSEVPSIDRHDVYLIDANHVAIDLAGHEPIARRLAELARRGRPMPLAILLGGDPAMLPLAIAPPVSTDEVIPWLVRLREKPVDVATGRTVDLSVPADAELVLEGRIEPKRPTIRVGPRPTITGRIGRPRDLLLIEISAVTHRVNPIVPQVLRTGIDSEETLVRRTLWRGFGFELRQQVPELVDLDAWAEGAACDYIVASANIPGVGQSRRIVDALLGCSALASARTLVLVDPSVDVRDKEAVTREIAAHADPSQDIRTTEGPPDPHDATPGHPFPSPMPRVAIDATAKRGQTPEEPTIGRPFGPTGPLRKKVEERWNEL